VTVIFGEPTSGQPFGPGVTYSVRSDLVGPVSGAHWRISLSLTSGALGNYQTVFTPANFNVFSIQEFLCEGFGQRIVPGLLPNYLNTGLGFLVGQLLDGSNSVVEQGQVDVALTWVGLAVCIGRELQYGTIAGIGGGDLSAILNAVRKAYANST
jgi:hypothetical protein